MVALPSTSLHTQPIHSIQPIDLPQRAPGDRSAMSPLAPNTSPSLPTAYPASQSSNPQPLIQPESHQPSDNESAAEDTAAYSPLLKDHVFALYCAGQRSPAIAAQLGIPERTVRHWIRATLQQLAEDDVTASPELARQQRALAIECQRAAAASAWDTYHRLTAAHNQLLDLALMSTIRQTPTGTDAPQPGAEATAYEQRLFTSVSRLASAAARYLSLAINANREIAHLQGHAITQDARERQATAAREAADARQLEADLIRAFTTPALPPLEPAPRRASASPYASSWPGGITTPSTQPRPAASIGAATVRATQPDQLAKTATSLGTAQAVSQSEKAAKTAIPLTVPQPGLPAKTAIPPTPTTRHLARPTLPSPAHGGGAGEEAQHPQRAEQPQSTARGQGERTETPSKTKIAAKTATPTPPHAVSKPPQPRRPASAKRKPQLILPSHQHPAAHPAS